MSEFTLRTYEPHDIQEILALERASVEAPQWGEAFWLNEFSADAALLAVFVAEAHKQVCGYAVVAHAVGIAELQSIVVSANMRQQGLGRALCERALQWARERGANSIELEVRESNTTALRLYRQIGFVQQGKRSKYYRDPEEDAVLMAAKL